MNATPPLPPVAQVLHKLSIPHAVMFHPGPVTSLEQAAEERGQTPQQVIRSLLFRIGRGASGGEYVMVLMAGPDQVSWKALRHFLGQSRLTTATEAEVLEVTGYAIGAVAPIGLRQPVRVLIDKSILAQDEISLGSGLRGAAIILYPADLLDALAALGLTVDVGNFRA